MSPSDDDASWASTPATRRSMRANRSRDTRPEVAVRQAAHRLGLRYRVCARPLPNLRRTADMVFSRAKVAVFVDGCFWHGWPDHYRAPGSNREYWSNKVSKNQRRDEAVDSALREAGWTVVRVWEHDNPGVVARRLCATGATRRRTPTNQIRRLTPDDTNLIGRRRHE